MTVDSPLELFTGIFAWQQYTALWTLLAQTGIWLIPFVVMLIKNVAEARTRQGTKDAAAISLRNFEVNLVLALSVIVLAGQPTLPLTVETMSYKPFCKEFGSRGELRSVRAGDTGTTHDETFASVLTDTKVPIWWYGIMALSSGITHAAVAGIECAPDVSGLQVALDKNRVDDSTLMAEMQRFTEECFIPARSRVLNGFDSEVWNIAERMVEIADEYGTDDIDWPGSRILQEIPGLYDDIRARDPVRGFDYDPARDFEPMYTDPIGAMPAGRPTCKEWWADPVVGLRQRIIDNSGLGFMDGVDWVMDQVSSIWGSTPEEDQNDAIVRRAWDNSQAAAPADASFVHSYNREGWTVGSGLNYSKVGAGVGLAGFMAIFKPTMYAIRASAPMVQPMILLGIITLLPFAIVFSNYSWTMVGVGSLAIFTVRFWSYLWFVAKWAEDQLTLAMYPGAGDFLAGSLSYMLDGDFAIKATIFEIVTGLMFVVLPVVFSMILAWAGFHGLGAVAAVGQSFRQKTEEGGGMAGRAGAGQVTQRLGKGGK